jgi:predicted phage terminase large subunit-like protein
VIADVATVCGPPHEVEALVKATAMRDGRGVVVSVPQDPGQAGVAQAHHYVRALNGYRVVTRRPTEKKIVRWGPVSSQVGARNVAIVRGPWNAALIAEGHAAPDGSHDDILDALADAHAELSAAAPPASYADTKKAAGRLTLGGSW